MYDFIRIHREIMTWKLKIISIFGFGIMALGLTFGQELYLAQENPVVTDFDVKSALDNVKDLQLSVEDITNKLYLLDDKERTWDNISDQYRETRKEIVNVIQNINQTTENASDMLRKIAMYKKMIFLADKELKEAREWIVDTKKYVESFSNFIYKLDNQLYEDDSNNIDEIKLIVNSDNIPRTLANDYMAHSIFLQFNDLLNSFNDNQDRQLKLIKKLNELKTQTQDGIKDYEIQLEKLQQKKNYLIQFMSLYNNDKIQRQLSISNLFQSTKWVYDKTIELVKDVKKWIYKTNDFNMDKKIKELNQIENNNEVYPLARPIYPITKILTYFGDMDFQKQYWVPHIWIQIQAIQWTPVYSTKDGIVYFVADNDDIWINRIMVVHTDWYISVYQYLNKAVVKPWDIVKRWQLIAYSGWEPWTRWAGFISKWANLTFVVFKDGMAIDPFDILDASIVEEKNALPEWYQIKYLRDKYARPIDITNLELMTWGTLMEREVQFLERYGVGIYRQLPFWDDAVKWTNIDRDVTICIAFAESTLWKYLSTSNNIGNVWNNDRGDRIPFYSAYQWARSIALTLNNGFLWDYHTIKQLSRYGNKDGKIYASSPINRQTNVLKCLSQIKWYYIPEDFPFRTGPNPNLINWNTENVDLGSWTINN